MPLFRRNRCDFVYIKGFPSLVFRQSLLTLTHIYRTITLLVTNFWLSGA